MAQRIGSSADILAIHHLIALYAERMDAGDLEAVAALFEHGEITDPESSFSLKGSARVRDGLSASVRIHADGTPLTQHVTTNTVVEFEGRNTASARSYFTVLQAVDGELALQPIAAGRYLDTFRSGAAGWEFAVRRIDVRLQGDTRAHTL